MDSILIRLNLTITEVESYSNFVIVKRYRDINDIDIILSLEQIFDIINDYELTSCGSPRELQAAYEHMLEVLCASHTDAKELTDLINRIKEGDLE